MSPPSFGPIYQVLDSDLTWSKEVVLAILEPEKAKGKSSFLCQAYRVLSSDLTRTIEVNDWGAYVEI